MIFIYFVVFVFGVIVFGVAAELHYTTKKKTAGNLWIAENGAIFVIISVSLNRNFPYPIRIKHINKKWLSKDGVDWWAIDDKRFYCHLGTKKKYPEYFL